jgi:hypothetical protein
MNIKFVPREIIPDVCFTVELNKGSAGKQPETGEIVNWLLNNSQLPPLNA